MRNCYCGLYYPFSNKKYQAKIKAQTCITFTNKSIYASTLLHFKTITSDNGAGLALYKQIAEMTKQELIRILYSGLDITRMNRQPLQNP
ncbi:MAG: hypothetical protein QG673_1031 [Pseudomonadota bacterium]|nr:hypothetical protein [Pseudomonadota bacterium]